MVTPHLVKLRAPAFLGGGPSPALIRRTDQRFIEGLLSDLRTEEGRAAIRAELLPRQDESEAVLFLPAQRCFNLVLAEAYCDVPGQPRLDPASLDGVGVVTRRRRAQRVAKKKTKLLLGPERWLAEHGRSLGWLEPAASDLPGAARELDEDPEPARRPRQLSGRSEIDRALALRRERATNGGAGPHEERFTDLYVAPPEVCAALETTLLYGLVDVSDPVVAESPRRRAIAGAGSGKPSALQHQSADVQSLLPIWLRQRSNVPNVPSALRGRSFRVHDKSAANNLHELVVQRLEGDSWVDFAVPEPWKVEPGGNSTDLAHFIRMLWQVRVELQAFSDKPDALPLLQSLRAVRLQRPSGGDYDLAELLAAASNVFVMLEEGSSVELPEQWTELPGAAASQIVDSATGALNRQIARFAQSEGRFDQDGSRYELRAFARVRHEDGCPSALVWSDPTAPLRVAKWYEGGPDDAVLPMIELPPLDRGFFKNLRPNVSVRVPRTMFNFLNNNSPDDLLAGNVKNDTRGPAIAWICGFNFSIIFTIAFMLLISFALILNIAFWWMAFFRICIPLPAGSGGEE